MAKKTEKLKLFKWDTSNQTDLESQFDINKALNENWDKLDSEVGYSSENVKKLINQIPKGTASGDSITLNDSSNLPIESIMLKGKTYQKTLPTEYQQVDYILNNNGTIDTGIFPNQNTKMEIEYALNGIDEGWLFGSRTSSTSSDQFVHFVSFNGSNNRSVFRVGNSEAINILCNYVADEINYGTFSCSGYSIKNSSGTYQNSITGINNFTGAYPLYLLSNNQGGSINNGNGIKLYYCKIYDGTSLIRNYIPCYRISDNVVGLYDLVNDVFYTNSGTGSFTYGKISTSPSIECPSEIQSVTGENEVIFTNSDNSEIQNYSISLGEYEIFEDGYLNIEYEGKAGYKSITKASIVNGYGRYVFTGNEGYVVSETYTNEEWCCGYIIGDSKILNIKTDGKMYASRFNKIGAYTVILNEECIRCCDQLHIRIKASRLTESTSDGVKVLLKEWYDTGTPLEIVYPLATPVETEITDSTLIAQLEALINAETYKGISHINTSGDDLNPEVEVIYKKDLETMFNNLNTAVIAIGGV